MHLERICSAINQLSDDADFDASPALESDLSQGLASSHLTQSDAQSPIECNHKDGEEPTPDAI